MSLSENYAGDDGVWSRDGRNTFGVGAPYPLDPGQALANPGLRSEPPLG